MNETTKRLWPSALVPLIFVAFTMIQFWPALTGAASISKVQQLAEWDSLFSAQQSGKSMLMDPSLVYLMIPAYLLKASMIHSFQLPLWNPYSGLGCPLAADPQTLAFSPLHIPLLLSPGLVAFNQVIVLEVLVLGLSTYALARSLNIGIFASAWALVAIAFCPYERWYLEMLGNGFCFVPLVFCVILNLRRNISAGKIWLAGLGCAAMLLSAHVELSFCSIILASTSLILFVCFDGEEKKFDPQRISRTFGALAAAGVVSFMLAAPMLVPFFEFLRNSDSYKFGSGAPAVVPWQTLVFNLLHPGYGPASPTLGPAAALLIPLAFCSARSQKTIVQVVAGLSLFCVALTGKMFPLSLILSHPPFNYLVVNYAFPALLLMTALLAAFGLDNVLKSCAQQNSDHNDGNLQNTSSPKSSGTAGDGTTKAEENNVVINKPALLISLALAMAVLVFPIAANALHLPLKVANFDMCMPDYAINRTDLLRYSIFAILGAAAVCLPRQRMTKHAALVVMAIFGVGQLALVAVAAKSMPVRPAFKYQADSVVFPLRQLTNAGQDRFIALGNHLFRPNSNEVFGLTDLRQHNPLFPKRYLGYVKACGAALDEFNQEFSNPLSPLLSVGAVKGVVSQGPVIGLAELQASAPGPGKARTIELLPNLRATIEPISIDKQREAIFAYATFAADGSEPASWSYNLAVFDKDGGVLWFSDTKPLNQERDRTLLALPLPGLADGKECVVGVQIFDNKAKHWLKPEKSYKNNPKFKDVCVLFTSGTSGAPESTTGEYKRVEQAAGGITISQNLKSVPRAYIVRDKQITTSAEESLKAIQAPDFDPSKTVVIEADGNKAADIATTSNTAPNRLPDKEEFSVPVFRANYIVVQTNMRAPGTLVLADMYYPGWQAKVNGKPVPILRANYAMRAIDLPAGSHTVEFIYLPTTFTAGVMMMFLALLAGVYIAGRSIVTRQMPKA